MMNPVRVTLILALIVLGLGGYILLVDIPETRQLEKQESQERQLLPFDDRAITHITWASPTETIRLKRDDQWRWEIIEPMRSPADAREIRRILRALTIGKIKRHIEDGLTNLSAYGLEPPHLTLTLTTPTDTQEMALGDAGPFAPSLYVQTKPDNQVVLTTLDVMTFAQKSLTNFRLKDLMLFDRDRVLELHIQQGSNTLIMTRVAGAHSLTPNWILKSPVKGPADKTAVGTFLMDLGSLAATGFIDGEEEKKRILEQPSRAQASIQVIEGSRTHHLELYQFGDTEKAYAVTSATSPLHEIPPGILKPVTQGIFHFQDKRLFGMEMNDLAMLMVQTPAEHYVLINQHDEWVLEDNPSVELDQQVVKLFISRVVDVPAEIFHPDSSPTSKDNGLASPTATILGRNRNGQEAGRLTLGKREKGLVFAKGASLPGLYQVRSTILDQIPTKAQLTNQPGSVR
ncbi:MAG: DUF4340 domain-containing protein [Nitrospirota bacterium]|nr:DUF4340 domain-containing protein [Nitrospirota bacterium]MDH4360325.1 DUF4340 domain-containing protein [Nitrospirota bacterium]MDH5575507.1 DUF4340 domain-containing protein [Nitrospirota bacterium]